MTEDSTGSAAVPPTEVIFIGGRSGVGKSAVGWEIHRLQGSVSPCLVEGDTLDQAWPEPWRRHPLAERNLAAIWRNYTELGYHKMIYTNTAAAVPQAQRTLVEALASVTPVVRSMTVLLTASDRTAAGRSGRRESGASLAWHLERSSAAAQELDRAELPGVVRIDTDDRTAAQVAAEIVALTGWNTAD